MINQDKINEALDCVRGLSDDELSAFNKEFETIMADREGEAPGADESGMPHAETNDLDDDQPSVDMDEEIPFTKKR